MLVLKLFRNWSTRGRHSCYSRPRVMLPSAASNATVGREQHEQRPRVDNKILFLVSDGVPMNKRIPWRRMGVQHCSSFCRKVKATVMLRKLCPYIYNNAITVFRSQFPFRNHVLRHKTRKIPPQVIAIFLAFPTFAVLSTAKSRKFFQGAKRCLLAPCPFRAIFS